MKTPSALRTLSLMVCGTAAALALSAPTFAQHGGGVAHGGGYHGGYGGGYGGYYGGYGWRGGYYGWGGGWYGPWAWGGVGLGLYFATLPLYYSTVWWEGVPYYYADNVYYRWDPAVSQYETVSQTPEIQGEAAASSPAASGTLIVYPKNGKTEEQQGKDKFECHRWAAGQRSDYFRAQAACLEGRGYTVK